jgi:hypothetical protein
VGSAAPRILAVGGTAAISAGMSAALLSIATRAAPLFPVSAAIAESGFGAAFSAYLRLLAPLAEGGRRGELYSAMYLVKYLAFGLPALAAGQAIALLGLTQKVIIYCELTAAASLTGMTFQSRRV